jgi:putative aminopeptidase FrvX
MDKQAMLALLDELLKTHSPPGEDAEIDAVIRREFEATGAHVHQDAAGNLIAHLPGDGPPVMICAHKDEIGMVVTHVLDDGRLKVRNIGGAFPWKYGEGPVDVLGDDEIVRGVLSVGSIHTRVGPLAELRTSRALTWDMVTIMTGMTPGDLAAAGVHPGSRACVARERKGVQPLGDLIGGFALDDRLGLVAMIAALTQFAEDRPPLDLHIVASTGEEIGMLGAIYAARQIAPEVCIALDTSPITPEVPVELDARPAIWYGEAAFNDKRESDTLLRLATELGFGAQPVVYDSAGSDAGGIKRAGLAARTVAFGFPRENSHGFEIAHSDSLVNVTRLLVAYVRGLC